MKVLFIATIIVGFAAALPTSEVFKRNIELVNELNKEDGALYTVETKFGSMSPEEFAAKYLMNGLPEKKYESNQYIQNVNNENTTVPDSWNWQDQGAVGPVRNQGSVGTCWAHAAVEAIESQNYLAHKSSVKLSVEQIAECDPKDCFVFGGYPSDAFEYAKSVGGVVSDEEMPYCAGIPFGQPGNCEPCMPANYNKTLCGNHDDFYCNKSRNVCGQVSTMSKIVSVKDWYAVSSDEEEIKSVLYNKGPISVGLNATPLQFYHSGIFNPFDFMCNPDGINHAVLLIGYGSEGNKDYWIVRNSWGDNWGEKGNFRIIRGKGKCGINKLVVGVEVN